MNKFLRTYLPAFSMAFTFIVLYATISNIIVGYSKDRFCFFILQVFCLSYGVSDCRLASIIYRF